MKFKILLAFVALAFLIQFIPYGKTASAGLTGLEQSDYPRPLLPCLR